MNGNLFNMEIRRNAISLLIWTLVITILISVTMSVYPTFVENQSKVMGMLSIVPKGILQFKGFSNINDLVNVLVFYASNNIIYMMVLGSIYAIVLSSNILLKEEYNKTTEYLLTRPLTRSEVFFSKLVPVLINVLILNLVTTLAGFLVIELVKNESFNIRAFLILSAYTFFLNILFCCIGLFLSTLIKRSRPIITFSIGLVLIFYFIYTLSKITEGISKLGYLSPFHYVNLNVVSPGYKLELWNIIFFLGLSFLLVLFSYRRYLRRDIYL